MIEVDAAYIAGFFDGEGTCGCRAQAKRHQGEATSHITSVGIVNTNRDILVHIQKTTGLGVIYIKPKSSVKHKTAYILDFPQHHVEKFLQLILPYLRVKKRQVELMLELKQMVKEKSWTDAQQIRRAVICLELSTLNARGS